MTDTNLGVCKKCGSPNIYLGADGYIRCRPCRKAKIARLGEERIKSGIPPKDCPKHHNPRYWGNSGDAICPICVKEVKQRNAIIKKNGPPPSPCPIHNTERFWSSEGLIYCPLCRREKMQEYRARVEKENIPPPPCPKHGIERHWTSLGGLYCSECTKEVKKRSYHKRIGGPPPKDCPKHKCSRQWNSEGGISCRECNREGRLNLKSRRESEGPPSPCIIHDCDRYWNTDGTAICKVCIKDSNTKRYIARMAEGDPEDCPIHNAPRKWDNIGYAVCRKCEREYALELGRRRKEEGPPTPCDKHNLPRRWLSDGRPSCDQCVKESRESLDREYVRWTGMNYRCHSPKSRSYKDYGGRGIFVHEEWRRDDSKTFKENYECFTKYKTYINENLGPCPEDHTLDRIDNNKGYEPGNIRWADKFMQANNQRTSTKNKLTVPDNSPIYIDDKLTNLVEFSEYHDIPLIIVKYRYSQKPGDSDFIVDDELDGRHYEYKNHKYNIAELAVISGLPYKTMSARISKMNWDVTRAVEEPLVIKTKKPITE